MPPAHSRPQTRPSRLLASMLLGFTVSAAPAHAADGNPAATTAQSIDDLFVSPSDVPASPAPVAPTPTPPPVAGQEPLAPLHDLAAR